MIGRKIYALYILAFLAFYSKDTDAARILGFFSTPSKSHLLIHAAIADTLARAGHDVTVIAVSKNVYPHAHYKFIEIELGEDAQFNHSTLQNMVNKPKPFYMSFFNLAHSFGITANRTLNHPKMQDFLRTHGAGAFDLLLLGYTVNDFAMGLGAHFGCPIILSFMVQPIFLTDLLVGNPTEHAYAPPLLSNLKAPLTFWERVLSFLGNFFEQWIMLPIFEINLLKLYNRAINAARILGFFSTQSKSHTLIHAAIADTLARAGHDVTVIAVSKNVYPQAHYKFIEIELGIDAQYQHNTLQNMVNKPKPFYISFFNLAESLNFAVNRTLNHPKMQDFLRRHGAGAFDLVLLGYTGNDFAMGLGAHFGCPIILSFMVQPIFTINQLVGNPSEHAYAPPLLSNLKAPLTFWERVLSFLANFFEQWIMLPIFEINLLKLYNPLNGESARILAFFPTTLRSHQLMNCAVADALAEAGHNVTVIGATMNVYPRSKYRYIRIEGVKVGDELIKKIVNVPSMNTYKYMGLLLPFLRVHNATLAQPKIQQFLKTSQESDYDLLLLTYLMNDFHLGLGAHFKCPIVVFYVSEPLLKIQSWVGNPDEFSYVPIRLSGMTQPLNFAKRVSNFLWYLLESVAIDGFMKTPIEEFYKPAFAVVMPPSALLCSLLLFIALTASRFELAYTARILGFFPSPSKSHLIVHAAIADTLAQAGHDVTVIGSSNNVYPQAKYKYIQTAQHTLDSSVITGMMNSSFYKQFGNMVKSIASTANASITHPRMQRFLQEHGAGDFDLLIVGYFMNDFHFGLAAHFQCPLVVSFMIQPIMTINRMLGNPNEMAYVPTLMGKQTQPMGFVARVKNLFSILIEELIIAPLNYGYQQQLYDLQPTACVEAARILGFFASPSKSHIIVHCAVADALAQAGHNVTVIASGPNVRRQAKYKYIELDTIGDHPLMSTDMVNKRKYFWQRFGSLLDTISTNANETQHHKRVQQFLQEHRAGDFDLLLFGYFMNDFQLGLAGHFRCPIVVSFMIQPIYAVNLYVGNPSESAYVPGIFGYLVQPMKFLERVKNKIVAYIEEIIIQNMLDSYTSKYYDHRQAHVPHSIEEQFRRGLNMSLRATVAIFFALIIGGFNAPPVQSARILGFFPSVSPSHLFIHCAVADALAEAGHNVTVLSSTKNPYKLAKYNYIQLDLPLFPKEFLRRLVTKEQSLIARYPYFIEEVTSLANQSFSNPRLRQFLDTHGEGSFDLLILGYFMNDFHLGLGAHFKVPIVVSFMVQPIFAVHNLVKNPIEPAYVPTLFCERKQPLDFWGRLQNYVVALFETFYMTLIVERESQKYYDYNFPPDRYPPFEDVRQNVSLIFTNHHFSQGPIRPNVPNLIEIGGIQIKEKPDPLPADIAKILDEAKEGAIYFSLGSNIQGSHLTEEKVKIMFNVISKLPYKVLWKWGPNDRPGQSENIIYRDWLPQDDILAHPNIKLFITHGGMGSVVEAQYHGVPMVGIPLFGDQPSNMANVQRSGYGLAVDYITLSEESLNNAIQEVLTNPKYTNTVQEFSRLYRDRPMTPRQTVVYWVEYVLRHKGAKHMQSPAVHMNRWQLMSLDVIGFLWAIFAGVVLVCAIVFRLLCGEKKDKKEVKVEKTKQK
ncbi:uncharacterized protein LOC105208779 [Zeugodacus cucurbitae]|uniref:uncharacterized protein LOC105208779 n=1 Tax=Zeugodacus cucurbitae TaxID=28588 RepID=UPI0023D952D9|nr:uncharacterized protein LOC105208779 [Zeugodacus cucurbitae]